MENQVYCVNYLIWHAVSSGSGFSLMGVFPKEFQPRFFEGFFRIPGTKESTGVGLGLAIARATVVSRRGSIGSGQEYAGSEFYFGLPTAGNGVKA